MGFCVLIPVYILFDLLSHLFCYLKHFCGSFGFNGFLSICDVLLYIYYIICIVKKCIYVNITLKLKSFIKDCGFIVNMRNKLKLIRILPDRIF